MILKRLLPLRQRDRIRARIDQITWGRRGYPVPAPQRVKRTVLSRHGIGTGMWVESGTFLGTTTVFLAKSSRQVFTIEPSSELAMLARRRFKHLSNVELLEGTSESIFAHLLPRLVGAVNFYLDGHASGGVTFQGDNATPIRLELEEIAKHQSQWPQLAVFVDDFRGFSHVDTEEQTYPTKSFLVAWAESLGLQWTVEHDIFVATRNST